jgi:hypothetical protein
MTDNHPPTGVRLRLLAAVLALGAGIAACLVVIALAQEVLG